MVTASYVLALMIAALPDAPPWTRATFPTTADAIAKASSASPLYASPDGDRRTAAVIVAVGTFESSLKPDAEGDCDPDHTSRTGVCTAGGKARSFCLLQVNVSNLAYGRTTREEILNDVGVCVRTGLLLMRDSFRICRRAPESEALAWYAGGGGTFGGTDARTKSKHRLALARRIYQQAEHADAVTSFVSFDVESEPAPGLERLD
jgi:hypothetical protein